MVTIVETSQNAAIMNADKMNSGRRPSTAKARKYTIIVLWLCATAGAVILGSTVAASSEIPPEYRYKNQQVALPPEIATFVTAKERQAEAFANRQNLELEPAIKNYFAAVKAGRVGKAQQLYYDLSEQARTNVTGQLNSPIRQIVVDVVLAVDALGENDPDSVLATARDMTNSLPPGCIYFGGTDPGRGLPTMLCPASGDPFIVLTQNQLTDVRYMELLRAEYGSRIRLPTTNEVQKCVEDYGADVQIRSKKGKLKPGENFRMVDGKPKAEGWVATTEISALIAKSIFDKNPDREFYYEESFSLDWMYPYLAPHRLLMRLNHQPLNEMPAEQIQEDEDFWSKEMAGKIGDWLTKDSPVSNVCVFAVNNFAGKDLSASTGTPKFVRDKYSMEYSKLRCSVAGVYAWRCSLPGSSAFCPPEYRQKTPASQQALIRETDFAFKQAFAFCPYSPEAVFRYVNFLLGLAQTEEAGGHPEKAMHYFDDAILIAKTSVTCLPKDGPLSHNEQIKALIDQTERYKSQLFPATLSERDLARLEKEFGFNPTNFAIGLDLARSYLSGGQTNKALGLLDQIVASKDVNVSALQNIAMIFAQLGNVAKLEAALARSTEVAPESPETWYNFAALEAALGKKSEAIADLKKALALNSQRLRTDPSAHDMAADASKDTRFNSIKGDSDFQSLLPQPTR